MKREKDYAIEWQKRVMSIQFIIIHKVACLYLLCTSLYVFVSTKANKKVRIDIGL